MSHMSLDNRVTIQEGLDQRLTLRTIAKMVDKAPSTILREINKHRFNKGKRYPDAIPPCARRDTCQITGLCHDTRCYAPCRNCNACRSKCSQYLPQDCETLCKSPYVCNGCTKQLSCTHERFFYYATYAHNEYHDKLISTREGIDQDPEDLQKMDNLVSPLIKKGQSIAHVFANHSKEINCSRTTLYKYINKSILTARNIDLPRKVRYKPRKKDKSYKKLTQEERLSVLSRSYERFKEYMEKHPDTDVVEMDTVLGPVYSKKAMLTLLFRSCNLMLVILLEEKTQEAVINALNKLSNDLGIELFQQLFPVILTDRGSEFLYPEAMECDENGEIKTKIFYCDPQCSWQKGTLEKNHEFIRYVIPKSTSFDHCNQDDITLMVNNINSLARDKFHGKTPYALSRIIIDNHLHEIMGLKEIAPDEVLLKPTLLRNKLG